MVNKFDVIIIGAGPAGSIAAFHLLKNGLRVLILEKSHFPRRKVCGGGLTHRALQSLPYDVTSVIHSTVSSGILGLRGRKVRTIHGDGPIAYLIDRPSFDVFLLKNALAAGAECQMGERFSSLIEEEQSVKVFSNHSQYQCRYLIGADGVNSLVAKNVNLIVDRQTSLSYEALLSLPSYSPEVLTESITFDFGTLLLGYGWIFPKKDHLNVGVFRSWPGKKTTKSQLMRFIHQHPDLSQASIIELRAHLVPLGGQEQTLNTGRVLLIGDAANLADPWLGEGLYYAIASGQLAAECVNKCLCNQWADLSGYTNAVNKTLIHPLAYARRLSILINAFPYLNTFFMKSSPILQSLVIDLLRGDRSHQEVWQTIKTQFPKILIDIIKLNQHK